MIKFESERSFEQFLFDRFNEDGLFLGVDEHFDSCYRQFDTKGYGICDLVFVRVSPTDETLEKFEVDIHVTELKNEQIKVADIVQICRYKRFFDRATSKMPNVNVTYSLVVPSGVESSDDCCNLIDSLDDSIQVQSFYLDAETGLDFDLCYNYSRVNEDLTSIRKILPEGVNDVS